MADRYSQLIQLVREIQPRAIVEVGVHRAIRASAMVTEALLHSKKVHYIGYDVFETKDDEFQKEAMNGKGTPTEAQARAVLNKIAVNNSGFTYDLEIGDTRDTLHGGTVYADFAFIDGDHRVAAIRGDYRALSSCSCIAFDDYIIPGPNGEGPDLKRYGANAIVDALIESGKSVRILPIADLCKHGGYAKIAVLRG